MEFDKTVTVNIKREPSKVTDIPFTMEDIVEYASGMYDFDIDITIISTNPPYYEIRILNEMPNDIQKLGVYLNKATKLKNYLRRGLYGFESGIMFVNMGTI